MLTRASLFNRRHGSIVVFVAGAGAVTEFGNRIIGVTKLLVFTRLVVVGVTSCAIWRVCSARIRDRLGIALMTIQTIEWLCVRARIVCRFVLVIKRWRPRRCSVAINAFNRGNEMVARFAGRFASIMAGTAIASYIRVIESSRQPRQRFVTITAICSSRYVIRMLTGGLGSVMTAGASSDRLAMVHTNSRPCGGYMAAVAAIGCGYMRGSLANCFGAIVATDTGTERVYMRECSGRPCGRTVTVFTHIRCG